MKLLEFIKIVAAVAVSIAAVGALFFVVMAGTLSDNLAPIREELKEIRENIHSIDSRLDHLEDQVESVRKEFASAPGPADSVTISGHSADSAGSAEPAAPTTLLAPSNAAD